MINYTLHTLPNGLRVLLAPMHETQATTILFVHGVGSRYETAEQNGLSHFLEHLFFKGTKKRPTTLDISKELDALGASFNAYTSEETTAYYVSAAAKHFPIAFDVLNDMLQGSLFAEEEIERERGVIGEEIKMYHNDPMSYLGEVSKRLIFGETPLGLDIAGTHQSIARFKRDDFLNYKRQYYGPENTILAIAGNPLDNDWLKSVEAMLAKLPSSQPTKALPQPEQTGEVVKVGRREIDQVHLSLMHYGVSHTDKNNPALDVAMNILGGTMSSRLFVEVRERRGLAYYVRGYHSTFDDIGVIECTAGVDPEKLELAVTTMIDEINKLKNTLVSAEELNRAKQNIAGRMMLHLEESYSIARFLSYETLERGTVRQPEEIIAEIEAVSAEAVMAAANRYLVPTKRKLALVGPIKAAQESRLTDIILEKPKPKKK